MERRLSLRQEKVCHPLEEEAKVKGGWRTEINYYCQAELRIYSRLMIIKLKKELHSP